MSVNASFSNGEVTCSVTPPSGTETVTVTFKESGTSTVVKTIDGSPGDFPYTLDQGDFPVNSEDTDYDVEVTFTRIVVTPAKIVPNGLTIPGSNEN